MHLKMIKYRGIYNGQVEFSWVWISESLWWIRHWYSTHQFKLAYWAHHIEFSYLVGLVVDIDILSFYSWTNFEPVAHQL